VYVGLNLFKDEPQVAAVVLSRVKLGAEPVTISLRGLDCMGDDISAARVIYAKVNASRR
jgi:hypothetical protein